MENTTASEVQKQRRGLTPEADKRPEKRSREFETEEEDDLVHKAKRRSSVCLQVDEETKHTLEEKRKALQEELQKPKPSKSMVKKLMEETSTGFIHDISF